MAAALRNPRRSGGLGEMDANLRQRLSGMTEHVYEDYDEILPSEPNGEVVHWMAPRPLALGPAGVSVTAAGAFLAGAAATLVVLGLLHWLGPERELRRPRLHRPRLKVPF